MTTLQESRLLSLPLELLEHVLGFLQKRDFKELRLSCQNLKSSSTPRLFDTVTYWPHAAGAELIKNIAEHDHLRALPTQLVCDWRYFGTIREFVCHLAWPEDPELDRRFELFEDQAQAFIGSGVDGSYHLAPAQLSSQLFHTLPRFTSLNEVVIYDISPYDYGKITFEDLPSSYQKACNSFAGPDFSPLKAQPFHLVGYNVDLTYTWTVLLCLQGLANPITMLCLKDIVLHNFFNDDFENRKDILSEVLVGLKTFELRMPGISNHLKSDEVSRLNDFFAMLPKNLECLQLTFRSPRTIENIEPGTVRVQNRVTGHGDLMSTTQSMFLVDRQWNLDSGMLWGPRNLLDFSCYETLLRLELSGVSCTFDEFKQMIGPCCKTLHHLCLADVDLLPKQRQYVYEIERQPRACLVKMFCWIQKNFNLRTVSMSKGFWNHGLQKWYLERPSATLGDYSSTLLDKLENFIIHGGECPLDHFAIKGQYDLLTPERKPRDDPAAFLNPQMQGDRTFIVSYEDPWAT